MISPGQKIEIELSKSKIVLLLFGALGFVAIGIWFVISPQANKIVNPTIIAFTGYASIIFFGLCSFFLIRKLLDNKPGLIIDDIGLIDNSSGLAAGQILWTDIEDISVIIIHKQKLIMLRVRNPQDYIKRQASLFKRKGMEFNNNMYGTPLSITANGLKTSFDDLLTILTNKFQETRMNA